MKPVSTRAARVLVLYQSDGGHTRLMADLVAEGAAAVPDTEVRLRSVTEATAEDLLWCDGVAAGSPTHMGTVSWEMKRWWDVVAQPLWFQIEGRIGCAFSSSGGLAGGGELTCQTLLTIMMNYGMLVSASLTMSRPDARCTTGRCAPGAPATTPIATRAAVSDAGSRNGRRRCSADARSTRRRRPRIRA